MEFSGFVSLVLVLITSFIYLFYDNLSSKSNFLMSFSLFVTFLSFIYNASANVIVTDVLISLFFIPLYFFIRKSSKIIIDVPENLTKTELDDKVGTVKKCMDNGDFLGILNTNDEILFKSPDNLKKGDRFRVLGISGNDIICKKEK